MIPWQTLATSQGFTTPHEWLTHLYHDRDLHQHEIAAHVGCELSTVKKYMKRLGIPGKPRGGSRSRLWRPLGTRVLAVPHWQELPLKDLCKALNIPSASRHNVYEARKRLRKAQNAIDTGSTVL